MSDNDNWVFKRRFSVPEYHKEKYDFGFDTDQGSKEEE